MKIFWSWQSDMDGKISRHFIKECLRKAVEELKDEAIFDDRVEIDHDTKDVPGSPPITDTILEKIKNCTVFVADITPIAQVESNKKKVMNPNVAIEMGYAISVVGNNNIVSILNESFGSLEDLPFDLKYKRGPITYFLSNTSDKNEIETQEKELITKLKIALKNYVNNREKQESDLDLDVNGHAIFFNLTEPLLRLSSSGWGSVKDKPYLFNKTKSYIYTKIIPQEHLSFSKTVLKKAMLDSGRFKIDPLFSQPDNSPEVNKYGSITIKFDRDNKDTISDFVQILENGSIVSISNSFLYYSRNRVYLLSFKKGIEKNLNEGFSVLRNMVGENEEMVFEIEVGLINGDNCNLILPKPTGNRYYPEPERGPLEKEKYILKKKIKLKDVEKINDTIREFILSLFEDLGIEFNYEDHEWN